MKFQGEHATIHSMKDLGLDNAPSGAHLKDPLRLSDQLESVAAFTLLDAIHRKMITQGDSSAIVEGYIQRRPTPGGFREESAHLLSELSLYYLHRDIPRLTNWLNECEEERKVPVLVLRFGLVRRYMPISGRPYLDSKGIALVSGDGEKPDVYKVDNNVWSNLDLHNQTNPKWKSMPLTEKIHHAVEIADYLTDHSSDYEMDNKTYTGYRVLRDGQDRVLLHGQPGVARLLRWKV